MVAVAATSPETMRAVEELLPTLPAHIVSKLSCEDATGDRSSDISSCVTALIGHGCSDGEIFDLVWGHPLGEKAREKKDDGKWLRGDIQRMRGKGFGERKPVDWSGVKTGQIVGEPKWKDLCIKDAKNGIIPNVYNAAIAVEAWLGSHLGYDEMAQSYVWRGVGREIVENDVVDIQKGLQFSGFTRVGKDIVNDAVNNVAIKNRFCPLLEYLNGLKWDGVSRVGNWLSAYLGAERTTYTDAIGQMSLIAMVARAYEPGCQADYMLVLEGEQGIFKSSLCRALVGDKWFAQDLPKDLNSKDTMQFLRGKWLIEAGEMYFATKADSALLKAFITRRVEKYRPPFERRDVSEPRRCLFIGTTNKAQYLRDETGARRFWPVKCRYAAIDRLKADRDQLFAEAVQLYRSGAQWWPDHDFETKHIAPEQKARQESDAWEDEIAKWLVFRADVTVMEVASGALNLLKRDIGRVEQNRIMAILEGLSWVRGKPVHGRRPWVRAQVIQPSAAA